MTATLLGALFLAAAAWAASQVNAIPIPTPNYALTLRAAEGAFSPGDSVELHTNTGMEQMTLVGSAVVKSIQPGREGGTMTIGDVVVSPPIGVLIDPTDTKLVKSSSAQAVVAGVEGLRIIEPQYLMTGAAVIVLIIGAVVVFWLVGRHRKTVDFLVATDQEMRKVNWSTRKQILGSTYVVIFASFILAGFLFVFDLGFSNIFRLIGVLQK